MQGTGQGNGLGPTTWTLVSSKMIEVMRKRGHDIQLRSSLSLSLISVVCFLYVDNCDIPVLAPTRTTVGEDIQVTFQEELDCWVNLLHATGGELDNDKLCLYLIDFKYTGNNGFTEKLRKCQVFTPFSTNMEIENCIKDWKFLKVLKH